MFTYFQYIIYSKTSQKSQGMNRFQIQEQIGHGAYSVVFRGVDRLTQKDVAIKRINHTAPEVKMMLHREIKILQKFSHPNIIKLLNVFTDNNFTYLVFEHMPCDLIGFYKDVKKKKFRCLNDQEVSFIMYQIADAIGAMHKKGIMHRDIKPQNILINPNTLEIKLIDFGFATESNTYGKNTQYMVTRWYRPLEIVLGLPYDLKVDIFSLGALMMQLYNCEQIFRSASNIDQMYWIIQVCGYPSWQPALNKMSYNGIVAKPHREPTIHSMIKKLRPEAGNLILGMLQTNPQKRLTINEILTHSYFSKYNAHISKSSSKNSTPQTTATPRSLLQNESNSLGKAYFKGSQLLLGSCSPKNEKKNGDNWRQVLKKQSTRSSQKSLTNQLAYFPTSNDHNLASNLKVSVDPSSFPSQPNTQHKKFHLDLNSLNTHKKNDPPATQRIQKVDCTYKNTLKFVENNRKNTNFFMPTSNSQPYLLRTSRKLSNHSEANRNSEENYYQQVLTNSNKNQRTDQSEGKNRNSLIENRGLHEKNPITVEQHYLLPSLSKHENDRHFNTERAGIYRYPSDQFPVQDKNRKRNEKYKTVHMKSENSEAPENFYMYPRLSSNTEGALPVKKLLKNTDNYYLNQKNLQLEQDKEKNTSGKNTEGKITLRPRTKSVGMKLVSMGKDTMRMDEENKKLRITSLSGSKRSNANNSITSNSNSCTKNANNSGEGSGKYLGYFQPQTKYHSNPPDNDHMKVMNSYTYNFHSNTNQNNCKFETNGENPHRKNPVFSRIRGKLVPDKKEHTSNNKIKISLADKRLSNHYNIPK